MAISDKLWNAISRLIKVADKLEGVSRDVADLAGEVELHEQQLHEVDRRLVRVETVLDLALASRGQALPALPRGGRRRTRR